MTARALREEHDMEERPRAEDSPKIRAFAEFLTEHREGELHWEVSEALNQVVHAVKQLGRSGSLTITLTIKPAGRGGNVVIVTDEVRSKFPTADRPEKVMFVDHDDNLTLRDPDQPELPGLREVPASTKELREVSVS